MIKPISKVRMLEMKINSQRCEIARLLKVQQQYRALKSLMGRLPGHTILDAHEKALFEWHDEYQRRQKLLIKECEKVKALREIVKQQAEKIKELESKETPQ